MFLLSDSKDTVFQSDTEILREIFKYFINIACLSFVKITYQFFFTAAILIL